VTTPIRTYDIRLWVDDGLQFADVWRFYAAVRELAGDYDGIDVRWLTQRRDRRGGPRIRVHPPVNSNLDADDGTSAGRSTR
jgi:hypothetical protein